MFLGGSAFGGRQKTLSLDVKYSEKGGRICMTAPPDAAIVCETKKDRWSL